MQRTDEMTRTVAHYDHSGEKPVPVYYYASVDISQETKPPSYASSKVWRHLAFVRCTDGEVGVSLLETSGRNNGHSGIALRNVSELRTGVSKQPDRYRVDDITFSLQRYGLTMESYAALVEQALEMIK